MKNAVSPAASGSISTTPKYAPPTGEVGYDKDIQPPKDETITLSGIGAVKRVVLLADGKGKKLFIPWFIVGSFAVAVAMVLFPPLGAYRAALAPIVGFLFSIAIAGIGLTMDLEAIIDRGAKPFLAVFFGWAAILAFFVAGLKVIG